MSTRCLLVGPDGLDGGMDDLLQRLQLPGPIVSITAGWQESEADPERLPATVTDLRLQARAQALFHRNPTLFEAHRSRQDRLLALQRAYRLRLAHALAAVRELQAADTASGADSSALNVHCREAINMARTLDRQHLRRVRREHAAFVNEWGPQRHPELAAQRAELAHAIDTAGTLVVAGGHAAALLNRVTLFGLGPLLHGRTLLAWGAGAMLLSALMVLYDDNAPQGARDPELLADGLGLAGRVVCFPRARERLDLADQGRLALLARRIAPLQGITLDAGCVVDSSDGLRAAAPGAHQLRTSGRLARVELAA